MLKDPAFLFSNNILQKEEWKSPNSYSGDFGALPSAQGIYLLIHYAYDLFDYRQPMQRTIVYIGRSDNLNKRFKNHEVMKKLQGKIGAIKIYFKQTTASQADEEFLIRMIKPKFNIRKYERIWE